MGHQRRADPSELRERIEDAARQAFLEVLEAHPDEHVYAFALYSYAWKWTKSSGQANYWLRRLNPTDS